MKTTAIERCFEFGVPDELHNIAKKELRELKETIAEQDLFIKAIRIPLIIEVDAIEECLRYLRDMWEPEVVNKAFRQLEVIKNMSKEPDPITSKIQQELLKNAGKRKQENPLGEMIKELWEESAKDDRAADAMYLSIKPLSGAWTEKKVRECIKKQHDDSVAALAYAHAFKQRENMGNHHKHRPVRKEGNMKYDLTVIRMDRKSEEVKFGNLSFEECIEVMEVFVKLYDYGCEFRTDIV